MQYINLQTDQLDEGVKDAVSSVIGMFKKNNVDKLRTKYMKKGDSRIFATQNVKGNVYVSIYNGKKKIQEEQFNSIPQADQFLEQYAQDGYEVVKSPSKIKKAGTWLGDVAGGSMALTGSFSVGNSGAAVISTLMSGVPSSAAAGMTTAAFGLVGGIVMVFSFITAGTGWVLVKASQKKRKEINRELDVVNLSESVDQQSHFQLDEGVKDILSSAANIFKRNPKGSIKTKYLKKDDNRVFATEGTDGKVHVSVFEGKTRKDEKTFNSIKQADSFLSTFEDDGYEQISKPSEIKKAASWVGTVFGGFVVISSTIDIGVAGVWLAGAVIGAGGAGGGLAILGTGIAIGVNLIFGAIGWIVMKYSNQSRRDMKRNKEVINLEESAPDSQAAEEFIKKNKERFKKQYGEEWEKVLYSLTWKKYNNGEL